MKKTHQPKGDGKPPGEIPELPSAIEPPRLPNKHRYPNAPDCPPKDRADRIMEYLGKRDDIPPAAVADFNRLVRDYEKIINENFSGMLELADKIPKERHPLVDEIRGEASAKAGLAVAALKDAEDKLVKAIAAYELAAHLTMADDFSGGYRIATWAKALRVKLVEMKLEGS